MEIKIFMSDSNWFDGTEPTLNTCDKLNLSAHNFLIVESEWLRFTEVFNIYSHKLC